MDKNIPPIPPEEMELIGRYSRKAIPPGELYTFPLILCDNEIDRDGEKFTVDSLAKLAEMFRGKTGIFDHNPSGKEQTARIYSASLETDPSRTAADGEPYTFVRAKAYMVRSEKNRDLIAEIDAGIKKETSVCCKVDAVRCSVCGRDVRRGPCPHEKGKEYDGKICCHLLCDPCDAYEWSFVAVPAQRNAGVTKSFTCGEAQLRIKNEELRMSGGGGPPPDDESLRLSEMPSDDGVKSLRGEIAATAVKCNDESLRCGDASHPIVGADIIRPPHDHEEHLLIKSDALHPRNHPLSIINCPLSPDVPHPDNNEGAQSAPRNELPRNSIHGEANSGREASIHDDGVINSCGKAAHNSAFRIPHSALPNTAPKAPGVGADIIRPQQVRNKSEEESPPPDDNGNEKPESKGELNEAANTDNGAQSAPRNSAFRIPNSALPNAAPKALDIPQGVGADIIRPQQVRGKSEEENPHPDDNGNEKPESKGELNEAANTDNGAQSAPRNSAFRIPNSALPNAAPKAPKALLGSLLPKSAPAPKEDTSVYII